MSAAVHSPTADGGGFDPRATLAVVLRYWYVFAISLGVACITAFIYLRITHPMYQVEAQVQIKDDKSYGEDILFSELGLGRKPKNLENEVMVMLSSPLMTEVVIRNSMNYRYFREDGPVLREMYLESPIQILDWSPAKPYGRVTGEAVMVDATHYQFRVDGTTYEGMFEAQLKLPEGKLVLWSDHSLPPGESLIIMALSPGEMAGYFRENLEVSIAGEESSTMVISLQDVFPQRAYDALMGLIEVYNKHSVDEKNKGYQSAIRLITERLDLVSSELAVVETEVETFKSSSITMEVGAEGNLLMAEMSEFDRKISELEVQVRVMDAIEDVLVKSIKSRDFVPTNLSLNSAVLNDELKAFNMLLAQRQQIERRLGPDHPDLQSLDTQIGNQRSTILDNLDGMKRELNLRLRSARQQQNSVTERTRSLPGRQRELVERERRKGVVENLYLYLLQKREELGISMAVTTSSGTVVEPALIPEVPVSPKGKQIWLIAIFLGLAVPSGGLVLFTMLNDRVVDATAIARVTNVPILGSVAASRDKENMVVKEKSHSPVAEMFRLLRTDLMYLTPGEDLKVLLITSSCSGEGKSFISMNLGMSLAITGKKVLILELDLRKPKQERYFGIGPVEAGIVNYLVDPSVRSDQIILNSGLHPGLDVILSGPTPPNPGELILSKRLRSLVAELRKTYDTIILDSPPVGMVADALQLADLPQATMYVVRAGYTRIPQLKVIDEIHAKQKLPKPFIVLNGVRVDRAGTYGGYGYGYGYYAEEKTTGAATWWRGILHKWRGVKPA